MLLDFEKEKNRITQKADLVEEEKARLLEELEAKSQS